MVEDQIFKLALLQCGIYSAVARQRYCIFINLWAVAMGLGHVLPVAVVANANDTIEVVVLVLI